MAGNWWSGSDGAGRGAVPHPIPFPAPGSCPKYRNHSPRGHPRIIAQTRGARSTRSRGVRQGRWVWGSKRRTPRSIPWGACVVSQRQTVRGTRGAPGGRDGISRGINGGSGASSGTTCRRRPNTRARLWTTLRVWVPRMGRACGQSKLEDMKPEMFGSSRGCYGSTYSEGRIALPPHCPALLDGNRARAATAHVRSLEWSLREEPRTRCSVMSVYSIYLCECGKTTKLAERDFIGSFYNNFHRERRIWYR